MLSAGLSLVIFFLLVYFCSSTIYSLLYIFFEFFPINFTHCRAFSTLAALEQSYYENGVTNGFLNSDDKVLFSPQAYGKAILEECESNEDVCKEYGKGAYYNTTQGGDIAWVCTSYNAFLFSPFPPLPSP